MLSTSSKTAVVVAAHPDDETLGCGATIAKLSDTGWSVTVLVFTNGVDARLVGDPKSRLAQYSRACRLLGAESRFAPLGALDQELDLLPIPLVASQVERLLAEKRPSLLLTHHLNDLNSDHRRVADAALVASRPFASTVQNVATFEVPSSTEWSFGYESFSPNLFVEISEKQIARKLRAMAAYEHETRPDPHPRAPQRLDALASYRGSQAGVNRAEAFRILRWSL
jgi:LmbE family N-acetylglucosaminyl deacetylase